MGRAVIVAAAVLACAPANAAEGEAHGSLELYAQPAPSDWLIVFTPTVSGRVTAPRWLTLDVHWTADVVTGATPRTYGPTDVITAATRFSEVRNVLSANAEATVGPVALSAGYAYGTESDYRSHLVRLGARADLFDHNTVLTAGYHHSFDSICDLAQASLPVLLRQPLDQSRGCFGGTVGLTEESLDIDGAELSWTQTMTPKWIGSVVGTYQHLGGFQSNPYRRVWLDGGRYQAQESHPRVRDRGSLTGRVRYAVGKIHASLGLDLRLYRDTWGVQSLTGEATWEQPLRAQSRWRISARTRGYAQSGALFYRDAGDANSYDRAGPVGSWFTADQALAPLADLLFGVRLSYAASRPADHRYWRAFTDVEPSLLLEYIKIFALSPDPPNAARINNWASALVFAFSVTGKF